MVVCGTRGVCGHDECSTPLKYDMNDDTAHSKLQQPMKVIETNKGDALSIDTTLDEHISFKSKTTSRTQGKQTTKIINPRTYVPYLSTDQTPKSESSRPIPPSPPEIRYIGNSSDFERASHLEQSVWAQRRRPTRTIYTMPRSHGRRL
ncbi:hypothetical protein RF11_13512 [Thelohanellus kitauei]|uniref:Uncharacterized protein n=1 Tax=Thelohanellus kitauei TaxID=669202 RepID=A0A0C2N8M5_THEKT|nr:hypothetical protein RF11_13512 [Thelohanellus kitauei]